MIADGAYDGEPVYRAVSERLRARTLPAQKTEVGVGCAALNRMTRLGMPVARRVA